MKKIFSNNRLIAIAFFTVFSVAIGPAAMAHGKGPGQSPIELKYLGKAGDQPMFQLNINGNAEENQFTITVKDEYDNSLYSENIKAETFSKKFLLNTDEMGYAPVKFEVYSRKSRKTVVFEVVRNRHYQDEMVINTIK